MELLEMPVSATSFPRLRRARCFGMRRDDG
jgi:hypothetical protein